MMDLGSDTEIIDLTHPLSSEMASWNGRCGFTQTIHLDYADCPTEVQFRVQQLKMHSGIGTHMDAPLHCVPGGLSILELDIHQFLAPCVVIDLSAKVHPDYLVSLQDIADFEAQHGEIPLHHLVIIRTGWDRHWADPIQYRNDLKFPSVSKAVAQYLVERSVVGLGIDTLSPDRPESGYPVHQVLLGAGKYILENVANASALPPMGAYGIALPLKIAEGTEAPLRLVALVNYKKEKGINHAF